MKGDARIATASWSFWVLLGQGFTERTLGHFLAESVPQLKSGSW